jgi:hypothetical protein
VIEFFTTDLLNLFECRTRQRFTERLALVKERFVNCCFSSGVPFSFSRSRAMNLLTTRDTKTRRRIARVLLFCLCARDGKGCSVRGRYDDGLYDISVSY